MLVSNHPTICEVPTMGNASDRDLGMTRAITRRDFLNGVSIALTGSLVAPPRLSALGRAKTGLQQSASGYYPPALTGLRGSHDGSFEVGHRLRDGETWDGTADDTGETYDLIIVGGGISGLAAAVFYRQAAGPRARNPDSGQP